jgi:hypothetical protein
MARARDLGVSPAAAVSALRVGAAAARFAARSDL